MGLKAPELSGRTVGVLGETRGGVVRMAKIVAAAISSSQPSVSPHETTIHKSPMLRPANRTLFCECAIPNIASVLANVAFILFDQGGVK